jgi:hypothetical protein
MGWVGTSRYPMGWVIFVPGLVGLVTISSPCLAKLTRLADSCAEFSPPFRLPLLSSFSFSLLQSCILVFTALVE